VAERRRIREVVLGSMPSCAALQHWLNEKDVGLLPRRNADVSFKGAIVSMILATMIPAIGSSDSLPSITFRLVGRGLVIRGGGAIIKINATATGLLVTAVILLDQIHLHFSCPPFIQRQIK